MCSYDYVSFLVVQTCNFFSCRNIGSRYHRNPVQTVLKSKDLWPLMNEGSSFNQQSAANEFLLTNVKDEMSDSFPKLSEMMYCNSSTEDSYLLSKKPELRGQDLGGNLWYSNMTERQHSTRDLYTNANDHSLCDFNHIFPSTNISTSGMCSTLFSSSLDLNLKSFDLLASTYGGGSCCNQTRNALIGHNHRTESNNGPSTSSKVCAYIYIYIYILFIFPSITFKILICLITIKGINHKHKETC